MDCCASLLLTMRMMLSVVAGLSAHGWIQNLSEIFGFILTWTQQDSESEADGVVKRVQPRLSRRGHHLSIPRYIPGHWHLFPSSCSL